MLVGKARRRSAESLFVGLHGMVFLARRSKVMYQSLMFQWRLPALQTVCSQSSRPSCDATGVVCATVA